MFLITKQRILLFSFAIIYMGLFQSNVSAQGGWRQWDIHLVDGSRVQASPLQLSKDGRFTRSMSDKEVGIERSKISYIAAVTNNLPPLPKGKFKKDLIVMLDGGRSLGAVTVREIRFSEGIILQNGKELTLENVAYIIFARSIKKSGR